MDGKTKYPVYVLLLFIKTTFTCAGKLAVQVPVINT